MDIGRGLKQHIVRYALRKGHSRVVVGAIQNGYLEPSEWDYAIRCAEVGTIEEILRTGVGISDYACEAAIHSNRPDVLRLLLKYGATIPDHACEAAIVQGSPYMLLILLQRGAPLSGFETEYATEYTHSHPNTHNMMRVLKLYGFQ